MILSKMQMVAIGVVAVVLIGGLSVAFVLNDDDDDNPPTNEFTTSALFPVFGNANEDLKLDGADMAIIQSIIDGNAKFEDYPLADANDDGKINSKDIAQIGKLINNESCTVTVVGLDKDDKQVKVKMDFPVKNTLSFGTNMALTIVNAGASDSVVGVLDGLSYEKAAQKTISDNKDQGVLVDLGLSRSNIDSAVLINGISGLDNELGKNNEKIGALFLDHSARGLDEFMGTVFDEIPVLRLAVADPLEEIYASRLIGFLTGNDAVAYDYAEKSIEIIDYVMNAVKNVPDNEKKNYICMTMGIYICENDSEYNVVGEYAGATPYYKVNSTFAEKYVGDGSTKMNSVEALSNYTDIDFMISNRSVDYLTTPKNNLTGAQTALLDSWDKSLKSGGYYSDYYKNLSNYEGLVYLNNLLPGALKIAFTAALVNPNQVSMDYALEALEDLEELCVSLNGVTFENSLIIGTYDDYENAGGANVN